MFFKNKRALMKSTNIYIQEEYIPLIHTIMKSKIWNNDATTIKEFLPKDLTLETLQYAIESFIQ